MSYNSLKLSIYSFFFVILLACPVTYDFSKNKYVTDLCENLGIQPPKTQDDCVLLLYEISYRYADQSLRQKAKNDPPNDVENWRFLLTDIESEYGKIEPLLSATRLKKIPQNEFEWDAVKNTIETLMEDCFDIKIRNKVQFILNNAVNTPCGYKKAFSDLAPYYPFPSPPKNFEEAIKKCQDLAQKCQDLDQDLVNEINLRLLYQALIDFHELIIGLVEECYPEWAEHREEDDFSDDVWNAIFLNIEHPRMIILKTELKNANVTEEQFIKTVNNFLRSRKNIDAPKLLSNSQREKAYPELLKTIGHTQRIVVKVILQFSYVVEGYKVITLSYTIPKESEPLPTTVDPRSLPLARIVTEETKKLRKNKKLMQITNPLPRMLNADDLLKELLQGDDKSDRLNLKPELQEDNILACYVPNETTVYVLFDDFESAYKALTYFKNKEHFDQRGLCKYLIRTVHDVGLQGSKLKIESASDVENVNLRQNVSSNLEIHACFRDEQFDSLPPLFTA